MAHFEISDKDQALLSLALYTMFTRVKKNLDEYNEFIESGRKPVKEMEVGKYETVLGQLLMIRNKLHSVEFDWTNCCVCGTKFEKISTKPGHDFCSVACAEALLEFSEGDTTAVVKRKALVESQKKFESLYWLGK